MPDEVTAVIEHHVALANGEGEIDIGLPWLCHEPARRSEYEILHLVMNMQPARLCTACSTFDLFPYQRLCHGPLLGWV